MITMSQPSLASEESAGFSSSAGSTDRIASQSRPPEPAKLTLPRPASEPQGTQTLLRESRELRSSGWRFLNWNSSLFTWLLPSGLGSNHHFEAPQHIARGTILFG